MILGIGNDLVDIRRIAKAMERHGERFLLRCYRLEERAWVEGKAFPANLRIAAYAKRFAAKEACVKALGTGFAQGVGWQDMCVLPQPSGRPILTLSGGAAARLERLVPRGMAGCVHLSLTDEPPFAQAFVVLSADPVQLA